MARRPPLPRIADEMVPWVAALEAELSTWPDIDFRPMFGLTALYRGTAIFGALPRTRGMRSSRAISLKFDPLPPSLAARAARDERLHLDTTAARKTAARGMRWHIFELNSDEDVRDAVWWLHQAYACAAHTRRERVRRR